MTGYIINFRNHTTNEHSFRTLTYRSFLGSGACYFIVIIMCISSCWRIMLVIISLVSRWWTSSWCLVIFDNHRCCRLGRASLHIEILLKRSWVVLWGLPDWYVAFLESAILLARSSGGLWSCSERMSSISFWCDNLWPRRLVCLTDWNPTLHASLSENGNMTKTTGQ